MYLHRIALAAAAILTITAAPAAAANPVFYTNTIDYTTTNTYQIARFDGSTGRTVAAADGCHLAAPSPIRYHDETRLYVAEHDCHGWHRVSLYISRNNGLTFTRYGVVLETADQLRAPEVVYDNSRFHLWYSLDRGGLGRALAYADSVDGLKFTQRGVKMWANDLTTLAVAHAIRVPSRGWRLLTQSYSPDLTTAAPRIIAFADPRQTSYRDLGTMQATMPAPKLDASYVCQMPDGSWRGLFTAFGAAGSLFAFEWTVAYSSPSLMGPWTPNGSSPWLPLLVDGASRTSVENPEPVRSSGLADVCSASGFYG